MIDGMADMYRRDALAVMDQSELYSTMSGVVDEVAQLIYHARSQLDAIDLAANEEIERLKAANQGGGIGAAARLSALVSAIAQIVAQARARATAVSADVAAEILSQGARIGADPKNKSIGSGGNGAGSTSADDLRRQLEGIGLAGGPLRNGMPTGMPGHLPEDGPGGGRTTCGRPSRLR